MTTTKTERLGNAVLGAAIALNVAFGVAFALVATGTGDLQATAIGITVGSFTFPPAWRWVTPHAS